MSVAMDVKDQPGLNAVLAKITKKNILVNAS